MFAIVISHAAAAISGQCIQTVLGWREPATGKRGGSQGRSALGSGRGERQWMDTDSIFGPGFDEVPSQAHLILLAKARYTTEPQIKQYRNTLHPFCGRNWKVNRQGAWML